MCIRDSTERHTERDRERHTHTETERQTERDRERHTHTETERQTESDRDRERHTESETETEWGRQTDRQGDRDRVCPRAADTTAHQEVTNAEHVVGLKVCTTLHVYTNGPQNGKNEHNLQHAASKDLVLCHIHQ